MDTVAGPAICGQGRTLRDPAANGVRGLALDPQGVVFVDTGPLGAGLLRRSDRSTTTFLHTGVAAGDPPADPAAALPLGAAGRLASDGHGGVLVAAGARVVDLDSRATTLTTVTGDPGAPPGVPGTGGGGDGGPAAAARFGLVRSITTDDKGNLFVADARSPDSTAVSIRFVNRTDQAVTFYGGTPQQVVVAAGQVATIAGDGKPGNSGDGGPARQASIEGTPPALAVGAGQLYIALFGRTPSGGLEARVRMVNLGSGPVVAHGMRIDPGAIDTVAGGAAGFSGDGGPARSAGFSYVPALAVEGADLYIADQLHHRIREIDGGGTISTVVGIGDVGPGDGGFNGDGHPPLETRLNRPADVKAGRDGELYIADDGNQEVRVLLASGQVRPAPGNGPVWTCEGGGRGPAPPALAQNLQPLSVASTSTGDIFFASPTMGQVLRISSDGSIAALPGPSPGAIVAEGPAGGIYAADQSTGEVRYVNPGPRPVRANGVAVPPRGTGAIPATQHPPPVPPGTPPRPNYMIRRNTDRAAALAADGSGNLFLADAGLGRVLEVDVRGRISVFAGLGAPAARRDCCRRPVALLARGEGVYVSDADTFRVWLVNSGTRRLRAHGVTAPPGAAVPLAGNGVAGIGGDGGPAAAASLRSPSGLAADRSGDLDIADSLDAGIRRVDPGGVITTIAGSGQPGFNGDGFDGRLTSFDTPRGLAIDRCGNLLIADSGNDRIRRLSLTDSCIPARDDRSRSRPASGHAELWVTVTVAVVAVGGGLWVRRRRRGLR